jgi:hypothetical protein
MTILIPPQSPLVVKLGEHLGTVLLARSITFSFKKKSLQHNRDLMSVQSLLFQAPHLVTYTCLAPNVI